MLHLISRSASRHVNFNANSLGCGSSRLLDATSVELPAQLLPPDEDQLVAQAAQTARAERELGMAENQAFQDAFNISVQTNSLGELGRRLGLVSLDASNVGGGDNRSTSISELRLRPSAARAAVAAHQELMASGSSKSCKPLGIGSPLIASRSIPLPSGSGLLKQMKCWHEKAGPPTTACGPPYGSLG